MAKTGKAAREKGHRLERELVNFYKSIGFGFAKTARQESRNADNTGIDLVNVPFIIQAKAGYKNNRPKYENIYDKTKAALIENYPKDHEYQDMPIVLVHKLDGGGIRHPQLYTWTFDNETIQQLLAEFFEMRRLLKEHKIEPYNE